MEIDKYDFLFNIYFVMFLTLLWVYIIIIFIQK